jgi:hypothetical protein
MKKVLSVIVLIMAFAGCRDRLEDPVGLDEVPRNIPTPVYLGDLVRDSLVDYTQYINTGVAQRFWFGKKDSIEARTLIRFAIADSYVIANADSATVTLTLEGSYRKGVSFGVYPLTTEWDEATVAWDRARSDQQWNTPGGDYDTSLIAQLTFNDDEEQFTFSCNDFSLLDTLNYGMILVYALGDTILSVYSREHSSHPVCMTVYFADSSREYHPVSDAFIMNDDYVKAGNEFVIGEGRVTRALIDFSIDTIPPSVTVNKAFLTFGLKPEKSYFDSATIYLNRITGDWDSANTEYSTGISGQFLICDEDTLVEVDVTSLVQYWVNERNNKGILLRSKTEGSVCARVVFDALQLPTLSVYYTPAPESEE